MNVLLSIKPEFVNQIRQGNKKFEFRKQIFKKSNIEKVIVYETSPVSKVIGEFTITEIKQSAPDSLWMYTRNKSGISKEFFDAYFKGREIAFAIGFEKFIEYKTPRDLSSMGVKAAPQGYVYVDD